MKPKCIYIQFADMVWRFFPDLPARSLASVTCDKDMGVAQAETSVGAMQRLLCGRLVLQPDRRNKKRQCSYFTASASSSLTLKSRNKNLSARAKLSESLSPEAMDVEAQVLEPHAVWD